MQSPIDVFISYVQEDDGLRKELEEHLALLKRDRVIRAWHQRMIGAGSDFRGETSERLCSARVVVLLVSASYLASDRYEEEMVPSLARAREGAALAVPVLLHAYDLPREFFAGLVLLPRDKPPVASWPNRHDAWASVVREMREAIEALGGERKALPPEATQPPEPRYEDGESRVLAKQLEAARARRKALSEVNAGTAGVDAEILDLRRRLREGGRLRPGDTLEDGRYLLLEPIGCGGFASVWSAVDREGGERVAIKVLHAEMARDPSRRERFFRGARVMADLGHEAVVRVLHPRGDDGGWLYFVMELVPGGDLHQAVIKGIVTREQAVSIVLGVGEALAEAHAKGIVHRDVKPANILLDASGVPRLTDFDLVAVGDTTGGTRTGAAMGSYVFMAPEQISNAKSADARADVYGLGMTAMFCLHGSELPESTLRRPDKVIEGLRCSSAVKAVLTKAIELDPTNRFANARAFCEAMREAVELPSLTNAAPWGQMTIGAVTIVVAEADITLYACDVLVLKYAQEFHGADRAIAKLLEKHASATGFESDNFALPPGEHHTFHCHGEIAAKSVLFLGVRPLEHFKYNQINEFAAQATRAAAQGVQSGATIAMTIHGVGYGLDERQAFGYTWQALLRHWTSRP